VPWKYAAYSRRTRRKWASPRTRPWVHALAPRAAGPAICQPPTLLDGHHRVALRLAREHRRHHAQRELALAERSASYGPEAEDPAGVPKACRQLRILAKGPWDAAARLVLGRAYFDLGMGAEAERAFLQAGTLASREPTAYISPTLEHAYRGDMAAAGEYHAAQERGAGRPPLASLLAQLQRALIAEGEVMAEPGSALPGR
jgi:hypothetical protein